MTVGELLRLPARAGAELRRRGLARTANNPCADHAETLAARTFGWTLNPLSNAGFDAWTTEASPLDRLLGILFDAE